MATLSDLPDELLFKIFSFSSPKTIVRLRSLSKRLLSATNARIVWLTQLYNECARLDIPPAVYNAVSMSDSQLEATILRPYRLLAGLKSAAQAGIEDPIPPGSFKAQSLLHSAALDPSNSTPDVRGVSDTTQGTILDPSGSFLITPVIPFLGAVVVSGFGVWDLRELPDGQPKMVVSIPLPEGSPNTRRNAVPREIFARAVQGDNTAVDIYIVAVVTGSTQNHKVQLQRLRVNALDSPHTLRHLEHVAEHTLPIGYSGAPQVTNHGNLLLALDHVFRGVAEAWNLHVWDFVRQTSTSWEIPHHYSGVFQYVSVVGQDVYIINFGLFIRCRLDEGFSSSPGNYDDPTPTDRRPDFVQRLTKPMESAIDAQIHRLDATHLAHINTPELLLLGVLLESRTGCSLVLYVVDPARGASSPLSAFLTIRLGGFRELVQFAFLEDSVVAWRWKNQRFLFATFSGITRYCGDDSESHTVLETDMVWVEVPAPVPHPEKFWSRPTVPSTQARVRYLTRLFLRETVNPVHGVCVLDWLG